MRKPNFFIVGAPKCGTTSLATWIGEHPNAFVSRPKEPCFFNTDIGPRRITSLEQYEQLFANCDATQRAIGEASTFYLQSPEAVPNILKYQRHARIIVMVRNPIEMVISLHNEEVRDFNETIRDFALAWSMQVERKNGRAVPRGCVDPSVLLYHERARLGSQLRRLRRLVPASQLQVIVLDDLKQDPLRVYKDVLRFLDLPYDGRKVFPAENQRAVWRSPFVQKSIRKIGAVKATMRVQLRLGLLAYIANLNRKRVTDRPLSPRVTNELVDTFSDEIRILGEECGRDFSHWITTWQRQAARNSASGG